MKSRTRNVLLLLLAALSFAAAGRLDLILSNKKHAPDTKSNIAEIRKAPPSVAVVPVVLGAFKGLLIDILWLKLAELQDRGRYLEIAQLASWITRLDPNSVEVWSFHAWNMAYNISVMLPNHEDRWRWVKNGLDLLCRDGLLYNPDDPDLHAEIAWMLQYKIGAFADKAHMTYKRNLAADMIRLLGSQTPDFDAFLQHPEKVASLHEEYGLDVNSMKSVEVEFGPLDWRLPETLAVYWAWKGLSYADKRASITCYRILYHSLAAIFFRGKMTFDSGGHYYSKPDPKIYSRVIKAFEKAIDRHPDDANIKTAFAVFLERAVVVLTHERVLDKAGDALQRLRGLRPDLKETDPAAFTRETESKHSHASALLPGLEAQP